MRNLLTKILLAGWCVLIRTDLVISLSIGFFLNVSITPNQNFFSFPLNRSLVSPKIWFFFLWNLVINVIVHVRTSCVGSCVHHCIHKTWKSWCQASWNFIFLHFCTRDNIHTICTFFRIRRSQLVTELNSWFLKMDFQFWLYYIFLQPSTALTLACKVQKSLIRVLHSCTIVHYFVISHLGCPQNLNLIPK